MRQKFTGKDNVTDIRLYCKDLLSGKGSVKIQSPRYGHIIKKLLIVMFSSLFDKHVNKKIVLLPD
jgi:hypothetical protein